ncbi:tetratricopeptide repeat protein [Actinoplanes sp. NPDC051411]|uniref:tetratricopeptide repeat protein n=1 Tax=Actinoplanes sp. NPDC051411 TaxID=3155522 RepID=UPI0034190FCE
MSKVDRLAEALGSATAAAVRAEFARRNKSIDVDHSGWKASGYSDAKLVAVVVGYASADNTQPVRCIAKICPPGPGPLESARHSAALKHYEQRAFVDEHLVDIAFDPVGCPDGSVVMGQHIAGDDFTGMHMLSKLHADQFGAVCREVRRGLLEDWTGSKFILREMTVPSLLEIELRGGANDWAIPADIAWIMTDEDGALPNPLACLDDPALCASSPEPWLVGHTHGDLHFENILVPVTEEVVRPDRYRLIDLSAFEPTAPLTRDPATLLVSILAHQVGTLSQARRNALLRYLVEPNPGLSNLPSDLAAVVDILRNIGDAPFDSWLGTWHKQFRVSVMAEAVRHSTYRSAGQAGRWWCLRLACLLARQQMPGRQPESDPVRLTAEKFAASGAGGDLTARPIVNQEMTRAELRVAISHRGSPVTLLNGPAGVGKSAIARAVSAELRVLGMRVVERRATTLQRPDAMEIVKILEGDEDGQGPVFEESVHVRLAAATDALNEPAVIVIDQADALLDDRTRTVVDAELDQAIEFIATEAGHRVRLVLVARNLPRSAHDYTWPRSAQKVQARGLNQAHFGRLLSRLDPPRLLGLAALAPEQIDTLCDRLGGNPWYAWLAQVIVHSTGSEYGAETLVEELAERKPDEVPRFLADTFKDQLHPRLMRLLAALVAFGTPVDADAVAAVVNDLPPRRVVELLKKLAAQRVIDVHDGRYSLPPADPYRVLDEPPVDEQSWQRMLADAARQLGYRCKVSEDVHGIDDLYVHFALIDVLRRAGRHEAAHSVMQDVDELLRRWDSEVLLLGRREHIRKHLVELKPKMANLNALGNLYQTRGRFRDALEVFTEALAIADTLDDAGSRLRIRLNMAGLLRDEGETEAATELFTRAASEAELGDNLDDQCAAAEGLGDCHRRWGDYREALARAEEALGLARRSGSEQTVSIALKLARWYAEIGELQRAEERIEEAESEASDLPDSTLRTACADARADLLLDQGRPDEALLLAEDSLARARRQRSLLIQCQLHTVCGMAHLWREDLAKAQAAIEAAFRIRVKGRSLIVPALRALVAALDHRDDDAHRYFDDLEAESERRGHDTRDVGALQYLGYAHCWRALTSDAALEAAIAAFRAARKQTRPAALGTERMFSILVGRLDGCGDQPGRLEPVLDAISGASHEPEPA